MKKEESKTIQIGLRIEKKLLKDIKTYTKRIGLNHMDYIRILIKIGFYGYKKGVLNNILWHETREQQKETRRNP